MQWSEKVRKWGERQAMRILIRSYTRQKETDRHESLLSTYLPYTWEAFVTSDLWMGENRRERKGHEVGSPEEAEINSGDALSVM